MKSNKVVWLTGLSGSGKTTIAKMISKMFGAIIIDGDDLRAGLSFGLGFSEDDRRENVRRAACVAKLLSDQNRFCIVSLISPFIVDRFSAKRLIGWENFIEVHVDAPIEICAERDPKGLYERQKAGEIKKFTGMDSPYEPPRFPDLVIRTNTMSVAECASKILEYTISL